MSLPNPQTSIDEQIYEYVSALSDKNKEAVLTVVRTISEAEKEAEFERKWAEAVPFEEAREHTLNTVRNFEKNWAKQCLWKRHFSRFTSISAV